MTDFEKDSRLTNPSAWTGRQHSRRTFSALIMNMVVYPLLITQTLVFILLAPFVLPMAMMFKGLRADYLVRYFIWVYGRVWMKLMSLFVSFQRNGLIRDNFPTPSIIVANHLSFFDIFCMGALPHHNIAFTVRSWPFRMFWYAPFMRMAGYVDMESQDMQEALGRCQKHLANNVSLVFFPEGHRSRDGKPGRFYSGAFKLAVDSGVPIVPMCITGTDQLLPPGSFFMAPAHVRIQALPAVKPDQSAGESAHVQLRKQVKVCMSESIENMRKQPGASEVSKWKR